MSKSVASSRTRKNNDTCPISCTCGPECEQINKKQKAKANEVFTCQC